MGKSLIIKGADFSQVAILNVVSDAQLSMSENTYYNNSGEITSISGITGVQKIDIPNGITKIRPYVSESELEPSAINCFDNN